MDLRRNLHDIVLGSVIGALFLRRHSLPFDDLQLMAIASKAADAVMDSLPDSFPGGGVRIRSAFSDDAPTSDPPVLSKRECFAAAALPLLKSDQVTGLYATEFNPGSVARGAVAIADALISALSQEQ